MEQDSITDVHRHHLSAFRHKALSFHPLLQQSSEDEMKCRKLLFEEKNEGKLWLIIACSKGHKDREEGFHADVLAFQLT